MMFINLISILFSLTLATAAAHLPSLATATRLPNSGAYLNSEGSPLFPLLENAKSSIDIEIYTMKSTTVRNLIRKALARSVQVRIIQEPDPVGEKCKVFGDATATSADLSAEAIDCADEQKLVNDVRKAGGAYVPFAKSTLCGQDAAHCLQHGKIAVIDGLAMVSTGNFDATNLCLAKENPAKCDRDFSLVLDDQQITNSLERIFEADLAGDA